MGKKSEIICSFNQKLSYDDFLVINTYVNKKIKIQGSSKSITKIFLLSIWLLLLIVALNTTDNTILLCIFILLILLLTLTFLLKNYSSLIAKIYSRKATEKKFTLFKDYILYESINGTKETETYKLLTQDISEIILTSKFCAIKFISKTILISLSSDNTEIETMITYLKSNYSNKIVTDKKIEFYKK